MNVQQLIDLSSNSQAALVWVKSGGSFGNSIYFLDKVIADIESQQALADLKELRSQLKHLRETQKKSR